MVSLEGEKADDSLTRRFHSSELQVPLTLLFCRDQAETWTERLLFWTICLWDIVLPIWINWEYPWISLACRELRMHPRSLTSLRRNGPKVNRMVFIKLRLKEVADGLCNMWFFLFFCALKSQEKFEPDGGVMPCSRAWELFPTSAVTHILPFYNEC